MIQKKPINLNNTQNADDTSCSVCRDLLAHMDRFFDILETSRRSSKSDWLTVDDIAKVFLYHLKQVGGI